MDRIIEKKKWTTKKILTIAAVSIFLFFLVYLLFIRDKQSRLYVDANQLSIVKVKGGKFQEFIPVDGVVKPLTIIYIDAVMGGTVEEIYVEDGDMLEEGDDIMRLVNANLELSYMDQETRMYDAMNNLQNSKIALEQNKYLRQKEIVNLEYQIDEAEKDFERKQLLFNDSVITIKEFEDAERDYSFTVKQLSISLKLQRLDSTYAEKQKHQINGSMARMQNNLTLLRDNMNKLLVKAPITGRLTSFDSDIGQTKSAGERLGQIDVMDGLKLRAGIDERYVSRVGKGQEAEFEFSGKTYNLYIDKIYTEVRSGSFQVDLLFFDKPPNDIKRGQTLQLRLMFSSETDAVIVKRGGYFQQTGGKWIYVVDQSGGVAVKRNIKIGRQNTRYYEVLDGLKPGEKVIISSYDSFGSKDKLIFK